MTIESTGIIAAGEPSRSAFTVAKLRAAHQLLDTPLVFDDPLALPILGPEHSAEVQAHPFNYDGGILRVVRTAMVVRSRLAEDELATFVQAGGRQYVVLGAGLDTFACRNTDSQLQVFEVDHPSTQVWKRAQLQQAGIALPPTMHLVAVDFEHDDLAKQLAKAGCRPDLPVFFSWLGVTLYLSQAAIFDTLRLVASFPQGSAIVFDYGVLPSLLSPMESMGVEHMAKKYAAEGEPWKSQFDPAQLAAQVSALGFGQIADLGAAELNARYLAGRKDALRMGSGTRLMLAKVLPAQEK